MDRVVCALGCVILIGCGGDGPAPATQPSAGGGGGEASDAGTDGSGGTRREPSDGGSRQGDGGEGGTKHEGGSSGKKPRRPPTGEPGPRFIGRVSREPEGINFAWSGSAVELRFRGTEISVTLDDWGHNFFEVIVDGEHHVMSVGPDEQTYLLASGLEPGEHEVLLYRRSEAFFGPTRFVGFSVPESDWLPSHVPSERRIEVVADSTATGYGVEGLDQTCGFSAETENHYIAYPAIAARALDAEVHTIAWSGIGVYRDNSGNPENTMGLRYPRAIPTDETSTWDFRDFVPQAVVINLGANDFVADDPGSEFEEAYEELLDTITSKYPGARLYCAVGSSPVSSEYSRLKPRIQAIVDSRRASGEAIALLDFGTTGDDEAYGCDWHPAKATHELMADILTEALRRDLGW
jgi:endoglucanase